MRRPWSDFVAAISPLTRFACCAWRRSRPRFRRRRRPARRAGCADAGIRRVAEPLRAGDSSVIGRTVRVNDVPATIIGVMPPGFNYPTVDQVWQAMSSSPNFATATRTTRNLSVVGRLTPIADLAGARAELDAVMTRLAATFPDTHRGLATFARPLRELYPTPPVQMIATMMGAVGFVLLIAYANLANLLLARSIRRSREIAIRLALGSSRLRVVRQFLLECLLIAIAGGAVGFALSLYGVRQIAVAFEPIDAGVPLGFNRPFWVDISPYDI